MPNVIAAAVINQKDCTAFMNAASYEDGLLIHLLNENSAPIIDGELKLIDHQKIF